MAEVEAWWFRSNLRGELAHGFYGPDDNQRATSRTSTPCPPRRCSRATPTSAASPTPPRPASRSRRRSARIGRGTELDLRWLYLHMIEEYARHNGHADLLRERIDGVTGD